MIAILLALIVTAPLDLRDPRICVSLDPKRRPSHAPLITGDSFRSICLFVIDETCIPFDTEKVCPGDTIFVGMFYLDYFFREIFPFIKQPFILVTSNGDGCVDERYRIFLDSAKIIAWFGRNITLSDPKAHVIPLGVCGNWMCRDRNYHAILKKKLEDLDVSNYFQPKPVQIYCNLLLSSHPYRRAVFEHFKTVPQCKFSANIPFKEYMKDLARSRFVISPRGVNIDCYRTWETLLAGSIPVVESEGIDALYVDLPVIVVEDLTLVTLEMLEREFELLKTKVFDFSKLRAAYWLDQIAEQKNQLIEACN